MTTEPIRSALLVLGLGLGVVVSFSATACGGSSPSGEAAADAAVALSSAQEAAQAAVRAIVADMRDAHHCNRINGCPGQLALMQHGKNAIPFILEILDAEKKGDGYWIEMLIDLLGQLDDARPLPQLADLANDPRWGIRLAAIRALGRLDRYATPAIADGLRAALAPGGPAANDRAWQAALHFALARIDPPHAKEHRDALAALLPRDRAGIEAIAHPMLDLTISFCGEARLPSAAPGIRWAVLSSNRFVTITAAQALATFRDTGAVPYLLTRLEDAQPGIRHAALAALQEITGNRDEARPDAWREWAKRYHLDAIPAEAGSPSP